MAEFSGGLPNKNLASFVMRDGGARGPAHSTRFVPLGEQYPDSRGRPTGHRGFLSVAPQPADVAKRRPVVVRQTAEPKNLTRNQTVATPDADKPELRSASAGNEETGTLAPAGSPLSNEPQGDRGTALTSQVPSPRIPSQQAHPGDNRERGDEHAWPTSEPNYQETAEAHLSKIVSRLGQAQAIADEHGVSVAYVLDGLSETAPDADAYDIQVAHEAREARDLYRSQAAQRAADAPEAASQDTAGQDQVTPEGPVAEFKKSFAEVQDAIDRINERKANEAAEKAAEKSELARGPKEPVIQTVPLDATLSGSINELWGRVTEIINAEAAKGRDANRNDIGRDERVVEIKTQIAERWRAVRDKTAAEQTPAEQTPVEQRSSVDILVEKVNAARILSALRGYWFDQNRLLERDQGYVHQKTREMVEAWLRTGMGERYEEVLNKRLDMLLDPDVDLSEGQVPLAYQIYP